MKKNKKILRLVVLVVVILGIVALCLFFNNKNKENIFGYYSDLPIKSIATLCPLYSTATPEQAIGVSDYAFVGKVNKVLRTEYLNPVEVEFMLFFKRTQTDPYTVYDVSVLENIKGNLDTSNSVEFMHYGGITENNKSYSFSSDMMKLLDEGEYYIFMPGVWGINDGGILETTDNNRIIKLKDYVPGELSDTVERYKTAYENEIVPDGKENKLSKFDVEY